MGFFSKFFSDDAGAADAPVITSADDSTPVASLMLDCAVALMETGKI